jgi:hypothetical protein
MESQKGNRVVRVAIAGDGLDRESLRQAIEQMRAIGGPAGRLGAMIAERLDALPDERKLRRDAAIVALAETFDGKPWQVAGEAASAILRYATSAWKRRDCRLAAPPLEYAGSPAKLALFAIMREGGGAVIGQKQIAKLVARAGIAATRCFSGETHGTQIAVSMSIASCEADYRQTTDRKGPGPMNAQPKPHELEALAALARQPSTKKLLADDRSRRIAERQAGVDRIKALDANGALEWPAGQAAIKEAVAKCRQAECRLREANDALLAATAAASKASWAYTRARETEEAALIAGADLATISAWRNEMLDEMAALQRSGVLVHSESVERHPVTRKEVRRGFSNAKSVSARLAAVRAAFEEAGVLALEPDQARLPAIIAEARASWPKVDANPELAGTPAAGGPR